MLIRQKYVSLHITEFLASLVLPKEVLLEMEEAPDERAVEEGRPLADVEPHAALVRLQRVRSKVGRGYHILGRGLVVGDIADSEVHLLGALPRGDGGEGLLRGGPKRSQEL